MTVRLRGPRGCGLPPAAAAFVRGGAVTALVAVAVALGACERPIEPGERDVLLGGLFSLTGEWSSLGRTGQAAMELAVEDVNRYLAGNPARVRFVAAIEDTRLEPEIALERAQALRDRGAQLLIGPQSSAEVERLASFVDTSDLLLVSPSSTAGALAIPGDNVFRFTPADSVEGRAVSALMWDEGVRAVVPVWREDVGNAGLEAATRGAFSALGGAVLEGVRYGATERGFGTIVSALSAQVRQAVEQQPTEEVAVYLTGFDEVTDLLVAASADPVLGSIRWYGSDGVVHNEALVTNRQAATFAMRVGYPSPIFGLDEGARDIWEPLVEKIRARTDLEPDAYALAVYDAVWVVARGYVASGAGLEIEQLKRAFTTAAATGFGATGWTVLNEAGDRKYGDFDFWAVREVDGTPRWTRVARYETRTGNIVRMDPPGAQAASTIH
jgi:branched-chain amino acid transport system substrate-binding protein